ncbi:hypothetical protein HDV02_000867, partial [Globomyces sp. JEL0801]
VGINRPFKAHVQAYQEQFMIEHVNDSSNPKITRELMSKWIADSWEKISCQTIKNTAHHIGFIDNRQ